MPKLPARSGDGVDEGANCLGEGRLGHDLLDPGELEVGQEFAPRARLIALAPEDVAASVLVGRGNGSDREKHGRGITVKGALTHADERHEPQ